MNPQTASSLTLSDPRWERSCGGLNRICEIHGLRNSYSSKPYALVDVGIADLVMRMNEAGLETEFSCSALDEDHKNCPWLVSGYISFRRPLPTPLVDLLGGYIEGGDCIRVQRVTNDHLKAAWDFVRSAFLSWLNTKTP